MMPVNENHLAMVTGGAICAGAVVMMFTTGGPGRNLARGFLLLGLALLIFGVARLSKMRKEA